MKGLRIEEIKDAPTRENFVRLEEEFKSQPFLKGKWRFVELEFPNGVLNFKFPHNLGFTPKDAITLSVKGPGEVTWLYDQFDRTHVYLLVSNQCTLRAFIGSYREE